MVSGWQGESDSYKETGGRAQGGVCGELCVAGVTPLWTFSHSLHISRDRKLTSTQEHMTAFG